MIPKTAINEYATILVPGITAIEVKIWKVTDEEVIGLYADGSEVHIRQSAINVWWPNTGKAEKVAKRKKAMEKRKKDEGQQTVRKVSQVDEDEDEDEDT